MTSADEPHDPFVKYDLATPLFAFPEARTALVCCKRCGAVRVTLRYDPLVHIIALGSRWSSDTCDPG